MHYRPDIDGLRALAVAAVVTFHAFPNVLPGGFVGVDVFFVISGFLITSIILRQMETGTFTASGFYGRRVLRIFPALVVMMAAAFVAGLLLLTNNEFEQLAKHGMASSAFVINAVLSSESGYFDNAAVTKPLLHLWSLAVEEQFYLFWPLVLLATFRLKLSVVRVLWFIVAASFAYGIALDAEAYYAARARVWELGLGAILATAAPEPSPMELTSRRWANACSFVGMALLAFSVGVPTDELAFPGWKALIPTTGAVLLIIAGTDAWVNRRILSHPVLVQIGLVSFSLYLWHWPLLVFAHIVWGSKPPVEVRIELIAASVVIAGLSYLYIEQPVRQSIRPRTCIVVLTICMVSFGLLNWTSYLSRPGLLSVFDGPASRIDGDISQEAFFELLDREFIACPAEWIGEADFNRCKQSAATKPNTVALVGDSHAEHLFIGLAESLPDTNVSYFFGPGEPYAEKNTFTRILQHITTDSDISTVILAASWSSSLSVPRLRQTLDLLLAAKKDVYLVGDVPRFSFEAPSCKFSRWGSGSARCEEERTRAETFSSSRNVIKDMADGASTVHYIDLSPYFCNEQLCSMTRDREILYRDSNHLNILGSRYVGAQIARQLLTARTAELN